HVTGVQTCALPIWPQEPLRLQVASRHRGRGDSLLADRDREAPRRESGALPHRSSEGRERRRDHHALAARLTRAELVASCPSDLGPRQHGARRALTQLCRACAAGVRAEPDARKKPWTTQNHARPGGPARKRERAEPITGAASTNRAAIFGAAPDVATHSDASSGPDRPDEHPRQPKPDSRTEPAERRPAAAPNLTPEPEPAER